MFCNMLMIRMIVIFLGIFISASVFADEYYTSLEQAKAHCASLSSLRFSPTSSSPDSIGSIHAEKGFASRILAPHPKCLVNNRICHVAFTTQQGYYGYDKDSFITCFYFYPGTRSSGRIYLMARKS